MEKIDDGLKSLLESGKEKGYLTYDQVNDHLPDDDANPEKIDQILILLEEQGIELIEESEAEEREGGVAVPVLDDETRRTRSQLHGRGRQPPHRRPGADVPHPDGFDPAAEARAGDRPGQEDRGHPQALPPQGAGVRRRLAAGGRDAQARPHRRPAVRPHCQGVADGEPRKGQDPPADAAQPADAGTPDGAESGGLRQGPRPAHRGGRTPPPAPPAPRPPPQGRDAGRGAVDPHAKGPAADEEAGADFAADGRAGGPDPGAAGRGRLQGRPGQPRKGTARLHDAHAGGGGRPPQARGGREEAVHRVRAVQARPVGRQPAAGGVDRQEVPQPRPVVPGPDPGGQHRPDAGGGQVRVPPRLQVQHLRDLVDSPGHHAGHRRPGPDDPHPGPHDRDDVEAPQCLQKAVAGRWAASRPSRRRPRRPTSASRRRGAC